MPSHVIRLTVLLILFVVAVLANTAQDDETDTMPVTLNFAAMVGEDIATCGENYAEVGTGEATISFNDFRFYVSNIQLTTAEGDTVPLELIQDGLWQVEDVVLLDFEDGSDSCSEIGNAALNGEVNGTVPAGEYTGVTFDLGVPFDLNHLDVTTAPSPLNIAALWWNWQGGYKFIRVDIITDAEENSAWNLHIGSTGCQSAAAVIPPVEACSRPNVVTVEFETFDFEDDVIIADLGGLLTDIPLYESTPMPPGCMSGIDDPDCEFLYPNLGLSLQDGVCPDGDCTEQRFFRMGSLDDVTPVVRTGDTATDDN